MPLISKINRFHAVQNKSGTKIKPQIGDDLDGFYV